METIAVADIVVPDNRQRREIGNDYLKDLRESIKRNGLTHAITLRDDGKTLVVGECRTRAVASLMAPYYYGTERIDAGHIPFVRKGALSPLQLMEVELEENTLRLDLTWQERDTAVANLHRLRTGQAAERGETQTKAKTVAEILGRSDVGGSLKLVTDALLISDHLGDPEISKAKSHSEALSLVKRKLTNVFNAKLVENIKANGVKMPHTLVFGDARELLRNLPDAYFDVICTDPPYGIDVDKMAPLSGSSSGSTHKYEDNRDYAESVWDAIFEQGARVCKPEAHLYMFFDMRHWVAMCSHASVYGWKVWPRPIIWHKPSGGMLGDSAHGPRMSYEPILFASRGEKKVTGVYLDVITANPKAELHAAEKPVEVITNLLRRSCIPGNRILDPCVGSGTIFESASSLSLFATGFESVEDSYNTALARMYGKGEK